MSTSQDASLPWLPPRELATEEGRVSYAQDCAALQALQRGEAEPHQQKRVLQLLIYQYCGTYDLEFRPGGEEGQRASVFAAGKRWVGLQLVTMLSVHTSSLLRGSESK